MRISKKNREAVIRQFMVYLSGQKRPKTEERLLILNTILRSDAPVSASSLHRYFSDASFSISFGAIYKTLDLLLELGFIEIVVVNRHVHYILSEHLNTRNYNHVDVILGLQWGDEGKGKIVDTLSERYDIIARFQGGSNAGHTLEFDGKKYVLHTIPSGIFHKDIINLIGNGVLIDPVILSQEIALIKDICPLDNLLISEKAHLIMPTHRAIDAALEAQKGSEKIGSTLKGIGPAYTDKTARVGLRVVDILHPDFSSIYDQVRSRHLALLKTLKCNLNTLIIDGQSFYDYERIWMQSLNIITTFKIVSCEYYINEAISDGKKILAEGAQGTLLDLEYGSYPYVTSSNTVSAEVCAGLGVSPHCIGNVYGVFKAYCTRVGNGPFPTELSDKIGELLQKKGNEFGSTTGRKRRCGWLDLPALKYAVMLNGVTHLIITKVDVILRMRKVCACVEYKTGTETTSQFLNTRDLVGVKPIYKQFHAWNKIITKQKTSQALVKFLNFIEEYTDTEISLISTGPDRKDIIQHNDL